MTELLTQPTPDSASPTSVPEPRKRDWLAPFLLVFAVILFLGRVCLNFFAYWDDQDFIFKNGHVTQPTLSNLAWFWKHTQGLLYVPVTMDVFVLLAKLSKLPNSAGMENPFDPAYFHAASLLTHIATVLVVYTLLKFLFQRRWAACAGALLFALHPVQVEPLAWTCGIKDLLCGFFSVTAIWQYLLFTSAGNPRFESRRFKRTWIHLAVAMLAVVLGELCKPSAMVAPIIAFVLDYFLIGRPLERAFYSVLPLLLVAIPLAIVAKVVQPESTGPGIPLYIRPLLATDALAFYLFKFAIPFNLAPDYGRSPHRNLTHHWLFWTWVVPLAVGILILAWRKKYPWLIAAALVSVISLAPVLGLSSFSFESISAVADHYLYVAMLGPAIVLAAIFQTARPRWAVALAAIWIVALGVRSTHQIGYWRDDITLWSHADQVTKDGMAVGLNLGASDLRIGIQFQRFADDRSVELEKSSGDRATPETIAKDPTIAACRQKEQQYYILSEAISRHVIDAHEFEDGYVLTKAYRNLIVALTGEHRAEEAAELGYQLLKIEREKNVLSIQELSQDRAVFGVALLDTKTRDSDAAAILLESLNLDPTNGEAIAGLSIARQRLANPSREAAVKFAKAIESGDLTHIHEVASGSDAKFEWVRTFSDWTVAYKNYQVASARQFGRDSRFAVENAEKMVDQVQDADEKIDGDVATLTTKGADQQPIRVIKNNGVWKVDLDTLWQDVDIAQSGSRVKTIADVYRGMTRDVEAGKFITVADAQQELKRRISESLPPEYELLNNGKPTTLPSAAAGQNTDPAKPATSHSPG
jgi:hypothetical protein